MCPYHLADYRNVPSIIDKGILSRNKIRDKNYEFFDVFANKEFVKRREHWMIPLTRKFLFDYARLYFNPKNPFMFNNINKTNDMALIDIKNEIFWNEKTLISDGNAQSEKTKFIYSKKYVESKDGRSDFLNYEMLLKNHTSKIANHFHRRQKMAEVLVEDCIEPEFISRIIVPNEKAAALYYGIEKDIPCVIDSDLFVNSSAIKTINGNLFTTNSPFIVNSVNCEGVMGAGIALEYKLRYPEMFEEYQKLCEFGKIEIGKLWTFDAKDGKTIVNLPSKRRWRDDSKIEYIEEGLKEFVNTYKKKGITSIAFPVLGADKGGLDQSLVLGIMKETLSKCNIPIEIYTFNKNSEDDIMESFKKMFQSYSNEHIYQSTGLGKQYITRVKDILENENIRNMRSLIEYDKIGLKTLEKCFNFYHNPPTKWFK